MARVISLKSNNPVSVTADLENDFDLLVNIKSIHYGIAEFF